MNEDKACRIMEKMNFVNLLFRESRIILKTLNAVKNLTYFNRFVKEAMMMICT